MEQLSEESAPRRGELRNNMIGRRRVVGYSTSRADWDRNVTVSGDEPVLLPARFLFLFAVLQSFYFGFRFSVTGTVLPSLTSMPRLTTWKPFNFSAITCVPLGICTLAGES